LQLPVPVEDIAAQQLITAAGLRTKEFDRPRVHQAAARCNEEIVNRYAVRALSAGQPVSKDAVSKEAANGSPVAGCPKATAVPGAATATPTPTPAWRYVVVSLPSSAVVPAGVLRPGQEVLVYALRATATVAATTTATPAIPQDATASPTSAAGSGTSTAATDEPGVCVQGWVAGRRRPDPADARSGSVTVVSVQGSGKDAVITLRIPEARQLAFAACLRDATLIVTRPET
jgi:hypothetical protein